MYPKKCECIGRFAVFFIIPIAFLTFWLLSPSSDLTFPNIICTDRRYCGWHEYTVVDHRFISFTVTDNVFKVRRFNRASWSTLDNFLLVHWLSVKCFKGVELLRHYGSAVYNLLLLANCKTARIFCIKVSWSEDEIKTESETISARCRPFARK